MVVKFDANGFMIFLKRQIMLIMIEALSIIHAEAQATVPKSSGNLAASIHIIEPVWITPNLLRGGVAAGGMSAPYAVFLEHGTGIYMDPAKQKVSYIDPQTKMRMSFNIGREAFPSGTGWWIIPRSGKAMKIGSKFVKKVSGVMPLHWLNRALELSRPFVIREFNKLNLMIPWNNFFVDLSYGIK